MAVLEPQEPENRIEQVNVSELPENYQFEIRIFGDKIDKFHPSQIEQLKQLTKQIYALTFRYRHQVALIAAGEFFK